jgi:mannose-6-phosphate isomerase-like protein (cupin superfamily)
VVNPVQCLGDARALIDIDAEAAAHDPWFNQTLTTVDESVIRLGVIAGEFHWHKHGDTDEFFLVLDGQLLIDIAAARPSRLTATRHSRCPRGPSTARERHFAPQS